LDLKGISTNRRPGKKSSVAAEAPCFLQTVETLAAAERYRGAGRDGHRRSISHMISFAKRIASEIAVIVAGILGALEY
jgi:hypothetical protein